MEETLKNIPKQAFEVNNMIFIPGGTFDTIRERKKGKSKVQTVTVADICLAACCVTFEEYIMYCFVTGKRCPNDEGWGRGKLPVINVSWYDAIEYCNFLSLIHGLEPVYDIDKTQEDPKSMNSEGEYMWLVTPNLHSGGYRLPTEEEWEYAARERGKIINYGNGQKILRTTEANFNPYKPEGKPDSEVEVWREQTVPVDSFAPNALGLYNMSGNVNEWCENYWYDKRYYPAHIPNDTLRNRSWNSLRAGYEICREYPHKALRGGSWYTTHEYCMVLTRLLAYSWEVANVSGFRLCRSVV